MIDVIRVDGAMQATFAEVEQVLEHASVNALVISVGTVERNLRLLRLAKRHALNVFEQSGKEISPLYQSLARSSNLSTGLAYRWIAYGWALSRNGRKNQSLEFSHSVNKGLTVTKQLPERLSVC